MVRGANCDICPKNVSGHKSHYVFSQSLCVGILVCDHILMAKMYMKGRTNKQHGTIDKDQRQKDKTGSD